MSGMRIIEHWARGVGFSATALCAVALLVACDEAQNLARAEQLWRSTVPENYVFVYERSCNCLAVDGQQVRVVVRDDEVVSARFAGGVEAPERRWITVDDLFAELRTALAAKPDAFTAKYDPVWGYPQSVFIDRYAGAADDEIAFSVTCLAPLAAASDACPLP
ncbi:MAG TPA: DUF6174 domain-containing protein [Polyangiaceae bacterium]|nr:DUF6174 domain-containing protein [Polyangiaceae bacterium]